MVMKRRTFIGRSCACLGGLALLEASAFPAQAGAPAGSMAAWTGRHLNEGFWSADSIFLSGIKFLKQPEDLVRVAMPFGGGLGQKDLCGYLTGGFMAIGLFAGGRKGNDRTARERCARLAKEYHDWWAKTYALHCREINKSQNEPCDYKAMGRKASDFLQALFERELSKG
jgi:C_GCAxxG_C_C family probable redox protein